MLMRPFLQAPGYQLVRPQPGLGGMGAEQQAVTVQTLPPPHGPHQHKDLQVEGAAIAPVSRTLTLTPPPLTKTQAA